MKLSKKYLRKIKKKLLGCTFIISICVMLISGMKLAGLSVPINAIANIKKYISTVISDENEISGDPDNVGANSISPISETGTSLASYTGERLQNTATETYIYTAQDLCDFRNDVNNGNDYAGRTVYLMNDIDLSTVCGEGIDSFEPIGTATDEEGNAVYFSGTFDGNYHTIDNLYMNTDEYGCLGLFIGNSGIIENIILENVNIYNYNNADRPATGGIVGANGKNIINSAVISGNVKYQGTHNKESYLQVGGITGTNGGTIFSCYNSATVISKDTNKIVAIRVFAGGIAGQSVGLICNCYNGGTITVEGGTTYSAVGGIAATSTTNSLIQNCYNYGSITKAEKALVGGIAGRTVSGSNHGKIDNSYCISNTTYSYYSTLTKGEKTGIVSVEQLKGYATQLGLAFENDDWGINEGYPILWWEAPTVELNKKQAYIKEGNQLQLTIVGAHCNVPVTELENLKITDFTWSSSNEDVAKVDDNALVTGVSEGYTTIYGKYKSEEKELYAMCVVYVSGEGNIATPQIATGNRFTAILKADGTVWTIGNSEQGQLGYENVINVNAPQIAQTDPDTELENVIKIAVGSNHVLALTNEGKVYAWGDNEYGQLGTGDTDDKKYATPVLGTDGVSCLENIVDIDAGGYGSVALDAEGNVYVWGNGANGEIGNNQTESKSIPTKVAGVRDGIQVSIGNGHVGALTSDGAVFTWGLNANGQLGINSTTNALYLTRTALEATEISLGGYHTTIKKIDGSLYVAGVKNNGRLGLEGTGNQTTFTKVNLDGILTEGRKIKYVKSGMANTTVLLSDGTVWETGFNLHGELGNGINETSTTFVQGLMGEGTPIQNVITIGKNIGNVTGTETTGFGLNTAVIVENGDIYTTGDNTYGQIGNNTKQNTSYYTKMGFAYLDYEEKTVEIKGTQGYQIDKNKIRYIQSVVNAYSNEQLLKVGDDIRYSILNDTIATMDENGKIMPKERATGSTRVQIEDVKNGYKTYFTIIVNKLENTETVTYIYDSEDMCEFRDSVNAGNDYAGKTVYVMADIDLSDVCSASIGSWEPIGTYVDETGNSINFSGTFDGNYHTISNLYINSNQHIIQGLFRTNSGMIQNLILENVNIYNYNNSDRTYTGGIAGQNLKNITNSAIISGNIKYQGTHNKESYLLTGGLVGGNNTGIISSCYNNATVISKDTNKNSAIRVWAGGIAGESSHGQIHNSYNSGTITAEGGTVNSAVGGIAAVCATNGLIQNSYNYGSITKSGNALAGGIAGRIFSSSNLGKINNSYCISNTSYSYNTIGYKGLTNGKVSADVLKTYTAQLGPAYENDDWGINDGYPILWWEAPTIELNQKQAYIKENEALQLSIVGAHCNVPVAELENLKITDFTWSSSNEDVAKVDENALVTGVSEGYTTIYGKYKSEEKELYAMCVVNVAEEEYEAMPQVETGENFTAILKSDGTVWTVGNVNSAEQNLMEIPQQVKINETDNLTDVIKIAVGSNHVLALTKYGEVYAWGDNQYGQLGINSNESKNYATKVSGEGGSSYLNRIIDISAGAYGSSAINEFGWVFAWGNGTYGEMGNGTTKTSATPSKTVLNNGISVSTGAGHNVALDQSGRVYTWGRNSYGELGIGSTANSTIVLKTFETATEISASGFETVVKDIEGKVYATGLNTSGQLAQGTTGKYTNITKFTEITLPVGAHCNVPEDGIETAQPIANPVKYIKAGKGTIALQLKDGAVYTVGINTNGELGNGTNINQESFVRAMTDGRDTANHAQGEEQEEIEQQDGEISPKELENTLIIGRSNGENTSLDIATINQDGRVYVSGANDYSQIRNDGTEEKHYFTSMRYIDLTCPDIIKVEYKGTRTLTEDELKYTMEYFNVYKTEQESGSLLGNAKILDTGVATYENPTLTGVEVGNTILRVEEEEKDIYVDIPVRVMDPNRELEFIRVDNIEAELQPDGTYLVKSKDLGDQVTITAQTLKDVASVKLEENEEYVQHTITKDNVALDQKETTFTVYVKAEDGKLAQYTLKILKVSDNTAIEELSVKMTIEKQAEGEEVQTEEITQVIQPQEDGNYYLKLGRVEEVDVKAILEDPNASVKIKNSRYKLAENEVRVETVAERTEIIITVQAEDGTIKDYTLVLEKKSNDTTISITKTDEIQRIEEYNVYVSEDVESLELTIVANNDYATLKFAEDEGYTQKQITKTIDLTQEVVPEEGETEPGIPVYVQVQAEDGTIAEYTIRIIKEGNVNLTSVKVEGKEISNRNDVYNALVEIAETTKVEITAEDEQAKIQIIKIIETEEGLQEEIVVGETSGKLTKEDLPLETDPQEYKIRVTSRGGTTVKDYDLIIQQKHQEIIEDTDTVIYIYNSNDLVRFKNSVNAGNDYAGKTVYVMADIDMSDVCSEELGSFDPIGATGTYFAGTFDGNYHTISNLYINSDEYRYLGLFSQTQSTALIKNLIMKDIYIYNNCITDNDQVGGIVGRNEGNIINCGIESGSVTGINTFKGSSSNSLVQLAVGGIAGASYGEIESCYNRANITATNLNSKAHLGDVGGIVGYITGHGMRLINCYNTGNVCATAYLTRLGGIIGRINNTTQISDVIINNCYNIGILTVETASEKYVAGIFGQAGGYGGIPNNSYCINQNNYSYYNMSLHSNTGMVEKELIKGYASTLGPAYENDDWEINEGYPILWWEAPTVELNKKQAYLKQGEKLQLEIIRDEKVEGIIGQQVLISDFNWTSSNKEIATVNQSGIVTALKEGYTTIYGKYKHDAEKELYVMCVVNVAKDKAMSQIETGENYVAILKSDGTVWVVGYDTPHPTQVKTEDGTELKNIIKIAVGTNHVLALTKDGEVYAWGDNKYGQLGTNDKDSRTYATKVVGEGGSSTLKRIVDISAGETGSSAINEDGWVYVWGNGTNGENGNGTTTSNITPTKTTINKGISISTGAGHNVALGQSGKVYTWGKNGNGELGIGNTTNNTTVSSVTKRITEISASGHETLLKDVDKKLYACGQNNVGQLGIETSGNITELSEVTLPEETRENAIKYIKAGTTSTAILLADGAVYTTGANTNGELGKGDYEKSTQFVRAQTDDNRNTSEGEELPKDLENTIMLGRSNGKTTSVNIATINETGNIYISGSNKYSQIRNYTTMENMNYFTQMRHLELNCPEKIELAIYEKRTLTQEELQYILNYFNVYREDQETGEFSKETTQISPLSIAMYENGTLTGIKEGEATLKLQDESKDILVKIQVIVYFEKAQIKGNITTENVEEKYVAKVKLYKRKRKEDDDEEIPIEEIDTEQDGSYVLDITEEGEYDLIIEKPGYLSYKVANIEITSGLIVEIQEHKLIAGDVVEDGEIELDDLVNLNANLDTAISEDNTEEKGIYDLNEDGKIDTEDRNILKKNYGKKEEVEQWVKPKAISEISFVGAHCNVPGETFALPLKTEYKITSKYGERVNPVTGETKLHAGIDLVGEHHGEILSITDGIVTYAGVQNGYGNCVEIKHIVNGETIYSFYAHLSEIKVEIGDKVKKGAVIGLEGGAETDPNHGTSTGHHLHFEIRTASGSGHSIDPTKYIKL